MKRYHEGLTTADYERIDARRESLERLAARDRDIPSSADLRDRGLSGPQSRDVPIEDHEQPGLFE